MMSKLSFRFFFSLLLLVAALALNSCLASEEENALSRGFCSSAKAKIKDYVRQRRQRKNTERLFAAIKDRNLEGLKRVIAACPALVHTARQTYMTPLVVAIAEGFVPIVKLLIDQKLDLEVHVLDLVAGWATAMHFACWYGNVYVVRLLVEAGAKINAQNGFSQTPLYIASQHGHVEILKFLIDNGADSNLFVGRSPLGAACYHGHLHCVEQLIATEADVNVGSPPPLFWAVSAQSHDPAIIEERLLEKDADVNAKDSEGKSVLEIALSIHGSQSCTKDLVTRWYATVGPHEEQLLRENGLLHLLEERHKLLENNLDLPKDLCNLVMLFLSGSNIPFVRCS